MRQRQRAPQLNTERHWIYTIGTLFDAFLSLSLSRLASFVSYPTENANMSPLPLLRPGQFFFFFFLFLFFYLLAAHLPPRRLDDVTENRAGRVRRALALLIVE